MSNERELLTAIGELPDSPFRQEPPAREPFRIGVVQERWEPDAERHRSNLAEGVSVAAGQGASLVCLQELTLAPYFAVAPDRQETARHYLEAIPDGPTTRFAAELVAETGAAVQASLYEDAGDGLGYNTAICVAPDGELVARTRKTHIPRFIAYHEDRYFKPGDDGFPVARLGDARLGFPTCWDQWFPEVARGYSIAGADVIVYPSAIGSEPDAPGFDSQPVWEHAISAHGIFNATFMVAVNRIGSEPPLSFYGSSFISDPYGRVLLRAPRDRPAVLVADLDLDQRRDWLGWGHLATRRPEAYAPLVEARTDAPGAPGAAASGEMTS